MLVGLCFQVSLSDIRQGRCHADGSLGSHNLLALIIFSLIPLVPPVGELKWDRLGLHGSGSHISEGIQGIPTINVGRKGDGMGMASRNGYGYISDLQQLKNDVAV